MPEDQFETQAVATAPRITHAELVENITHTEFVKHVSAGGQVLRWAVLTTKSGFAVVGRPSASVSPENDNSAIGEKVAYDNSIAELWPLMGYALKQRLHDAGPRPVGGGEPELAFPQITGSVAAAAEAITA